MTDQTLRQIAELVDDAWHAAHRGWHDYNDFEEEDWALITAAKEETIKSINALVEAARNETQDMMEAVYAKQEQRIYEEGLAKGEKRAISRNDEIIRLLKELNQDLIESGRILGKSSTLPNISDKS